jgi:uncharacterized repeat protein (TIGR02543 family)
MPNYNVVFLPIFKRILHSVSISTVGGGAASVSSSQACYGEVVSIHATPDLNMQVKSITVNGTLTSDLSFNMPNSDVSICVTFEDITNQDQTYSISPYDNFTSASRRVTLTPDKYQAKPGDIVLVTLTYWGNMDVVALRYYSNGAAHDITNYQFVMPSYDVELGVILTGISNTVYYNIAISEESQKYITVDITQATKGSPVRVFSTNTIDKLYYLSESGDPVYIPNVFNMPGKNITLFATFTDTTESIDLAKFHAHTTANFFRYGIKTTYYDRFSDINAFLTNNGLSTYIGEILEILQINNADNEFLVYNALNTQIAMALTQSIFLTSNLRAGIIDTYVVVSAGSNYTEIASMLRSELLLLSDFVLYKRQSGDWGLFSYIGQNPFVSIPSDYNGKSITHMLAGSLTNATNITKLNLGAITSIDQGAFDNLTNLKNIDLSDIVDMPETLLWNCTSLEFIYVDSSNPVYGVIYGMLYSKAEARVLRYPPKASNTSLTINPGGISRLYSIGDYAFYSSKLLTTIDLTFVTVIGKYAFKDCTNLAGTSGTLTLNSVVTIKDGAFLNCPKLTTFVLPALTNIGNNVFFVSLKTLTLNITGSRTTSNTEPLTFETPSNISNLKLITSSTDIDAQRSSTVWSKYSKQFELTSQPTNTVLVLFESNGGSYVRSSTSANKYLPLEVPTNPTKDGYRFVGWYIDEALEHAVSSATALASYTTTNVLILYAKYEIVE